MQAIQKPFPTADFTQNNNDVRTIGGEFFILQKTYLMIQQAMTAWLQGKENQPSYQFTMNVLINTLDQLATEAGKVKYQQNNDPVTFDQLQKQITPLGQNTDTLVKNVYNALIGILNVVLREATGIQSSVDVLIRTLNALAQQTQSAVQTYERQVSGTYKPFPTIDFRYNNYQVNVNPEFFCLQDAYLQIQLKFPELQELPQKNQAHAYAVQLFKDTLDNLADHGTLFKNIAHWETHLQNSTPPLISIQKMQNTQNAIVDPAMASLYIPLQMAYNALNQILQNTYTHQAWQTTANILIDAMNKLAIYANSMSQ